nr:unnamed protein product [Digitaria exilis]
MPPLPSRDGSDTLHRAGIATSRYGATVARPPALPPYAPTAAESLELIVGRPWLPLAAITATAVLHMSRWRERGWGNEPTRGAARPARSRGERGG